MVGMSRDERPGMVGLYAGRASHSAAILIGRQDIGRGCERENAEQMVGGMNAPSTQKPNREASAAVSPA